MQIATPDSTFHPRDEEGDGDRDVEGDFAFRLSLLRFVPPGDTAIATRAGADKALAA
jgi:hypothetical protein